MRTITHTHTHRPALVSARRGAVLLLWLAGCQGTIGGADDPSEPAADAGTPRPTSADAAGVLPGADASVGPDASEPFTCESGTTVTTRRAYEGLSPACVTCHGAGTARPYFAGRPAFETLIAARPEWVVPGQPDQSPLLALLRGTRPPPYVQMPLGGDSFAAMADKGLTSISLAELECWIGGLTGTPTVTAAGPLPVARRLSAEQLLTSLSVQLGLQANTISPNDYGAQSPDEIPQRDPYGLLNRNFHLLGGPNWMTGVRRSSDVDSALVQMWVNLSQRACRAAVDARTDSAIFTAATPADTSAAAPQKIRENITALSWRLLAIKPTPSELDAYFELFRAYEATSRPVAWTAVCTAMIRDPLWLTW